MNLVVHMQHHAYAGSACSISVWTGINVNHRKRLRALQTGITTAARYLAEVLLPYVHLFAGAVNDNFLYIYDNASCSCAIAVQDCLESVGVHRIM